MAVKLELGFDGVCNFLVGDGQVISPGAVATELPNSITDPDVAERIRNVWAIAVPADSLARAVAFAMSQP